MLSGSSQNLVSVAPSQVSYLGAVVAEHFMAIAKQMRLSKACLQNHWAAGI